MFVLPDTRSARFLSLLTRESLLSPGTYHWLSLLHIVKFAIHVLHLLFGSSLLYSAKCERYINFRRPKSDRRHAGESYSKCLLYFAVRLNTRRPEWVCDCVVICLFCTKYFPGVFSQPKISGERKSPGGAFCSPGCITQANRVCPQWSWNLVCTVTVTVWSTMDYQSSGPWH